MPCLIKRAEKNIVDGNHMTGTFHKVPFHFDLSTWSDLDKSLIIMSCTTTSQSHIELYMIITMGVKKIIMILKKINEAEARKNTPVFSGVLKYFPKALLEVSRVSKVGSEQHNPGEPLHWDKTKSTDELDALARHLLEAGMYDTDGIRHSAKIAWRALANLERELENDKK